MKIETLKTTAGEFEIWESDGHGRSTGKPGNYSKKTTGIQVREYMPGGGYLLLTTFNFPVLDNEKRKNAIEKARKYINESHQ
jgi:hypothetical protein